MRHAVVVFALLAAACGDDIDPPWELDHDRIVAVRATPPGIVAGQVAELDALLAFTDAPTREAIPLAASVVSPLALEGAVVKDGDRWIVTYPDERALAAARMELGLEPGAPVPLQVGVAYAGGPFPDPPQSGALVALKRVWLGVAHANPTLAEMRIDGVPMDTMTELVVPRRVEVRFSVPAIPDDDINWLTNVGEMHDFDLPEAYLRVEDDEDRTEGELVLVKRDVDGGVAWRVWPIKLAE